VIALDLNFQKIVSTKSVELAYDVVFPSVRKHERAVATFAQGFDQVVSPCLYPLYCSANFVHGSFLDGLDMFVRLPVSALDSRVDVPTYSANVFQRQSQVMEALSKEQRAEYDSFIDKPDIQWKIRDNEVYAAQCSPFPVFDLVDIHVLCATLVNEIESSPATNVHICRDLSITLVDDIYRAAYYL
jgi:hypothetical protein